MQKINLYDYLGNSIKIGIEVEVDNLDERPLRTSLHSNNPFFDIDTSYISSQSLDIEKQRKLIKKVKEVAKKYGKVNLIVKEENERYQLLAIINPEFDRN